MTPTTDLAPSARTVLNTLLDSVGPDLALHEPVSAIADRAGVSLNTAKRGLRELEARQLVVYTAPSKPSYTLIGVATMLAEKAS